MHDSHNRFRCTTGAARGAFGAAKRSKIRIMTKIAKGMMTDDGPLSNEYKDGLDGFDECASVPAWLANIRGTSNVTLVLIVAMLFRMCIER